MSLVSLPRQVSVDANGNPRVGAEWYFYQAGTTTPIPIYTTASFAVEHPNPVESVSSGYFPAVFINSATHPTHKQVLKDANGVTIFTEDNVPSDSDGLRNDLLSTIAGDDGASIIGVRKDFTGSAATTLIEILEREIWVNDFAGADPTGVGDNLTPITNALAAIDATVGGTIRMKPGVYNVAGTIDNVKPSAIDGSFGGIGGTTVGAILKATTNAPLLRYANTANRFSIVRNLGFVGDRTMASQDLLTIDNMGLHVHNCIFRNAGRDAIRGLRSVHGSFRDIYSSYSSGSSVHIIAPSASWNENVWTNVGCTNDDGTIWNIEQCDGADTTYGCTGEKSQTGYGVRFGANVLRWRMERFYTEENSLGSAIFDASSDYNHINFLSRNSSVAEAAPVNNGGTNNTWDGYAYVSAGVFSVIKPKLIDYAKAEYFDVASSAPNAIPLDNTAPQASGEGVTRMTCSITPKRIGNLLHVTGYVQMQVSAGTHAIAAAFISQYSATDAISARAVACGTGIVTVPIDFWYTVAATTSHTVNINIGSDSAATVTFNGTGGTRVFGSAVKSVLEISEYWP